MKDEITHWKVLLVFGQYAFKSYSEEIVAFLLTSQNTKMRAADQVDQQSTCQWTIMFCYKPILEAIGFRRVIDKIDFYGPA